MQVVTDDEAETRLAEWLTQLEETMRRRNPRWSAIDFENAVMPLQVDGMGRPVRRWDGLTARLMVASDGTVIALLDGCAYDEPDLLADVWAARMQGGNCRSVDVSGHRHGSVA